MLKTVGQLQFFGHSWGYLPDDDAVAIIDNHDTQRGDNGDFSIRITYKQPRKFKMANAFMLAWPYGTPKVMSSYFWPEYLNKDGHDVNNWIGPPSHKNFTIKNVEVKNDVCVNGWICEHRWRQIANMIEFRNVVGTAPVADWWSNGFQQIAFSRKERGFIAINNDDSDLDQVLQTALPQGLYCDVISGYKMNNTCTGRQIYVDYDSKARVKISRIAEDPIVAITIASKLNI